MIVHDRDPHAAFFEDWSAWASLDDLPEPPPGVGGAPVINGHRALMRSHKYRCDLCLGDGWVGGPHFEIVVPNRTPAMDVCRHLPGARRHPGLHGVHRVALSSLDGTWQIPAEHWQAVRRALPVLKSSILTWLRSAA